MAGPVPSLRYCPAQGHPVWYPSEPELRDEEVACFCCGSAMQLVPGTSATRWCPDCEVAEVRWKEEYPSRAGLKSTSWAGMSVWYLDHGARHYPNP